MDKTSFQIGFGKAQLIITVNLNKLLYMIDPENRDYMTSIKNIDSACETIPPILLIFEVNIFHKWCQYNDLDDNIVIGKTQTG